MNTSRGFSLIEIMIGLTLGIILSIAIIGVYIAQKNIYTTNTSQAVIQNAESAIAALVTPTVRAAGFCGCSTVLQALSNLTPGGPPPLGTLNTISSMVMGYDSAEGSTITITQDNAANSSVAANWSLGLDASLIGDVQATSDVLIVLGGSPGSQATGVTTFTLGSASFIVQNATGILAGQFGAISDCSKASIFLITSVVGTTIGHAAGAGALTNVADALAVNYSAGAQFVPLTQTAFFVAHDPGGQSALVRATLNKDSTWTLQSLIPGVDTMLVLYGVGSGGVPTEYVPANAVANWGQVYSVRLGFLLEGQLGSATLPATKYNILGTTVTVPADNRLRHVYEITINLRNSAS